MFNFSYRFLALHVVEKKSVHRGEDGAFCGKKWIAFVMGYLFFYFFNICNFHSIQSDLKEFIIIFKFWFEQNLLDYWNYRSARSIKLKSYWKHRSCLPITFVNYWYFWIECTTADVIFSVRRTIFSRGDKTRTWPRPTHVSVSLWNKIIFIRNIRLCLS